MQLDDGDIKVFRVNCMRGSPAFIKYQVRLLVCMISVLIYKSLSLLVGLLVRDWLVGWLVGRLIVVLIVVLCCVSFFCFVCPQNRTAYTRNPSF